VHYVHIDLDKYDYESFIRNLMNDIMHFKPDFVLTINHLGFDNEGRLTDLFNEMELPFVSWFVDSPNVILSSFDRNISDFCNIFVWDDDYLSQLKQKGYKHCDILPLATDTDIFYPKDLPYKYTVSFVGSSMVYSIHKNMQSWVHRDDLMATFPNVVKAFLDSKSRHVEPALAAVSWKATQIYRQSGIDKIAEFIPTVAGDPNWKNILPLEFEILPERWYYDDLVDYYNQSKINFNMTSLQMTNAINQRVFDVSACKRFILTDYRKQIDELFDGQENIVYFNDVDEIPDITKYYLNNEVARINYCNKAYNVVLHNHTYNHRLKKIIDVMKSRYK
jgi:spore maturation protein CgeB